MAYVRTLSIRKKSSASDPIKPANQRVEPNATKLFLTEKSRGASLRYSAGIHFSTEAIMVKFSVQKVINAPTDVVAKAMENPENAPYWQTDLERSEVVSGGPGQVGAIGRLHYNQKGRKYVLEERMLECEPGKRYLSEVSGDALTARVETTLESENGRTRMTIKWEGSAKMLALKMLFLFIRSRMVRQAQRELDTFARLVEARGSDFNRAV